MRLARDVIVSYRINFLPDARAVRDHNESITAELHSTRLVTSQFVAFHVTTRPPVFRLAITLLSASLFYNQCARESFHSNL